MMGTASALGYLVALAAVFISVAGSQGLGVRARTTVGGTDDIDPTSLENRVLTGFVVTFTIFFGSFFVLGFIELVTGRPVVDATTASVIGIAACVATVVWIRRWRSSLAETRAPGVGSGLHLDRPIDAGDSRLPYRMAALTALTFGAITILQLFEFPSGFEGQAKHLPMAVHFFQAGSLKLWGDSATLAFPANVSLYLGFFLTFLPERLVGVLNVPFLVPLSAAIYGLSRAIGADQGSALWAVLGILTVPLVAFGAFEAEADLAGISFLAAAVYFVTVRPQTKPSWPLLAGLAVGMAFGAKALHLVAATFVFFVIVYAGWVDARRRRDAPGYYECLVKPSVLYGMGAFAIAVYWLARNYAELGNPFYPMHIGLFDLVGWHKAPDLFTKVESHLFQFEWVRSSFEWLVYPWLEWHFIGQNFKASSGLGAVFAATIPVAVLASLVRVMLGPIRSTGKLNKPEMRDAVDPNWPRAAILLGGALYVLLIWWLSDNRQPRYAMGALVFLFPLAGWAIAITRAQARKAYDRILTFCVLTMLAVVSSKMLVEFGDRVVFSKMYTRSAFYEYPRSVDSLAGGATILNMAVRQANYSLFGRSRTNRVVGYRKTRRVLGRDTISGGTRTGASDDQDPTTYVMRTPVLRGLGATHAYVIGNPEILSDGCISLREVERIDINPTNGERLPKPRVLYAIAYCKTPSKTALENALTNHGGSHTFGSNEADDTDP